MTLSCFKNRFLTSSLLLLATLWCGAAGEAAQISNDRIASVVNAHVKQQLASLNLTDSEANISVALLHLPTHILNFDTVENEKEIQIEASSSLASSYTNRTVIGLTLTTPDGHERKTGIPVHIQIKKPVWVVKSYVTANSPIHRSDVTLSTKVMGYSYPYVVGKTADPTRYVARVNLSPGQLLDTRKILIPPDVSYNSNVRIVLRSKDGMQITVPGIALANGEIGQKIKVRQTVFKHKYYVATVVSKNKVLVEI